MKKILFMTALAAGFLTSCSEDDLGMQSSVDNNTIAFTTGKAQTRSGESINKLNRFYVTAVSADKSTYFNNEEFVYDGALGAFKANAPQYWPSTGTLSFFAINHTGTQSVDANNVPTYTYSNWAAEKDLVAATVIEGAKVMPYPLQFKHLTSQVYVSAEAANKTEELSYEVRSIKMTAPSTGTYSFATASGGVGSWSINNSQTSEYSFAQALPRTFSQNKMIELSSCYWNILPVTTGDLTFDIEYCVLQNEKVISDFTGTNAKHCVVSKPSLVAGKRYVYNFVLPIGTNDEITFKANIKDWEDGDRNNEIIPAPIKDIDLGETHVKLAIGSPYQIVAKPIPAEAPSVFSWSSSNDKVLSVDNNGNLNIVGQGTAVVTVCATENTSVCKSCTITVVGRYESLRAVDLNLPSKLKWANVNVGAQNEIDCGKYFAWGETNGYFATAGYNFSQENYTMASWNSNLNMVHDAANVALGSDWRMPTKADFEELIAYTNHSSANIGGHMGYSFTSKTNPSASIFIPFGGSFNGSQNIGDNVIGNYWSSDFDTTSNISYRLKMASGGVLEITSADLATRCLGYNIRPVKP